jgi:beta-carotene hydroxylase
MRRRLSLRYPIDAYPVGIALGATALGLVPFVLVLPWWLVAAAWIGVAYLRTFCAFAQHNHAHLPVFRAPLLNRAFDVLLTLNTGYATAVWELQHVRGHHRQYLHPDGDVASPYRPGTREPVSRWLYALRGNLTIHRDAVRVGLAEGRAGRKTLLPKLAFELSVQLALTGLLVAWRPWLGVAFFVVPNAVLCWMVWWESYPHHVGLPTTSAYDATVTIESRAYNRMTFNVGHHAAHHVKPTLHWSLLPAQTEKMRRRLDPRTIRGEYATVAGRVRLGPRRREAQTEDYRPGEGIFAAMVGDSTVRDFAIASSAFMLHRQWFGNQRNPFLAGAADSPIDGVFERLARLGPARAVEYARSGASVGAARTWWRRHFQWIANVATMAGQVDELLREPRFPDLTLIWMGHNNLDFVTELPRFSPSGDLEAASERIACAFADAFRAELTRLVERARWKPGPSAIVVYGLVNPVATRHARDVARERRRRDRRLYPYLEKTEARFPPLRPEHGDRLVALSQRLSRELESVVSEVRARLRAPSRVHVSYSDATARMDFSRPELLSDVDAWHASESGKALIAASLFEGLAPALDFLATDPGVLRRERSEATGTED